MEKASSLLILGVVLLTGCASKPHAGLTKYIQDFEYVAFTLPRSQDGVGTVIDFKGRSESIVARGQECLFKGRDPSSVTSRNVGAAELDQKTDWSAGASFSLPKAVLEYADVAGLVKASGAKSVKISLKAPFEQYISRLQFLTYINELPATDPCKLVFADPNNLIIYQVLGAKGLTYQFLDGSDNAISFTAEILNQVELKPELRRTLQGASKLEANDTLLIGYRTWVVTKPAGVIGTTFDVKEVSKRDVEARRESARQ
jgi:hypothetical protein